MKENKMKVGLTSVEMVGTHIGIVSGDYALVAVRTASNAYSIHMLTGKEYTEYLEDKDGYVFPEPPPNKAIAEMFGKLGNPGIWAYVKKEHYDMAVEFLDKQLGEFHDKSRGGEEVKFKDFQFRSEITACDFSHDKFEDEDVIVPIWRVSKKYRKEKDK